MVAVLLMGGGCVVESHEASGGGGGTLELGQHEAAGDALPPPPPEQLSAPPLTSSPGRCSATVPTCIAILESGIGQIVYVPLDGSPVVEGPQIASTSQRGNGSLGRHGDALYHCIGTVVRTSLLDGFGEVTDVPCDAATADEEGIWVASLVAQTLDHYRSFEDLRAHRPSATHPAPFASRIAVDGDEMIAAWHSTDHLLVGPPSALDRVIALDGYDDWIYGLDRLEDGRYVIAAPRRTGGLRLYGVDGSLEAELGAPGGPGYAEYAGIDCGTGPSYCPPSGTPSERPASLPIARNCGSGDYSSSNYSRTTEGDTRIDVVSVYEGQYGVGASAFNGHPTGIVSIVVGPTDRPVTLVLNAYERVLWTVALDTGARVAKVITSGHYEQNVAGLPPGTPVTHGGFASCAYGREAEHNTGGCSHASLMEEVRSTIGDETTFQGCYSGAAFKIPYI